MTAVLLAGAKAIRVMPSSARLPKALMPVGALTVVEILLHQLRSAGVGRALVCTGRHGDLIEAVVGDGRRFEMDISYQRDPAGSTPGAAPLDAVRTLAPTLPEHFLLMDAGTQCTLDFRRFFEGGRARGAAVAVAVHEERYRSRYGVAHLDESGRVTGFAEKPSSTQWVDMGIYACRRDVLDLVPASEAGSPAELVAALVAGGETVVAHRFTATWLDRPDERTSRRVSLGERAQYDTGSAKGSGLVSDLSLHGMLLVTESVLPVETTVALEWSLPGQMTVVRAQGVVTGVTGDRASAVAIGIRFTRVSEDDHDIIERYLGAMHSEVQ